MESNNTGYEIEGFKEHRGSYDIITDLRKSIINAEVNDEWKKLTKLIKSLIRESAPYNQKWKENITKLTEEYNKMFDDKFYINGELRKNMKKDYNQQLYDYLNFIGDLKAELLICFSKASLIPKSTTIRTKASDDKHLTKEEREEIEALEEVGIM